jgi:hypothetical protein
MGQLQAIDPMQSAQVDLWSIERQIPAPERHLSFSYLSSVAIPISLEPGHESHGSSLIAPAQMERSTISL